MKNYRKNRRVLYFRKQRHIGIAVTIVSLLCTFIFAGEMIVLSIVGIPLGLGLIFSKEPIWMDNYFWELKSKNGEL